MMPTFLPHPIHYTLAEFRAHLAELALGDWRPRFPTLHNTGVPSLAQWHAMGATPQERWGSNLNRYYQNMGWHAGPHLVVCPDYVWVLCDLTKSGVSVSCWNSETFGIEMVGNYEIGGDNFSVGDGARVRDNAALVVAALAEKFGWVDLGQIVIGEMGLHFHHDCARDHHACPGSKVTKPDMLARIASAREQLTHDASQRQAVPQAPDQRSILAAKDWTLASLEDIQAALNKAGARPALLIDGDLGPATVAAVKSFQQLHGLSVDGWPGVRTCAALEAALASDNPRPV